MTPVIKPDVVNIICGDSGVASESHETPKAESKQRKSKLEKIKLRVREVCEIIKPVIDIIVALSSTILSFLKLRKVKNSYCGERKNAYA